MSPVHLPAKVDLLIGQDNSEALVPLQVLKGNPGDPVSVLTKFGWTLNSVVPGSSPDCVSLAVVSNLVHTSIDAKVEVLSDIADDHVDPTLKSLSVSTDHKVVDICHGESIVVDVPIPRELSHVNDNFSLGSSCYNSLPTPAGQNSTLFIYDDPVKAVISKGLAEDIHVDVAQNHDPMSFHAPYYPVLNCSSDAYIFFDYDSRLREYSHNDCVFYDPPMFGLIPDCNMSLDVDAIVFAHSQLVSKALGISWVMPLKQWLSWLKSLGSLIINRYPMLCCQFVFDNG